MGHRVAATVPVRTHSEPHRRQPLGIPDALHRKLARLLRPARPDANPLDTQRQRRRRAVVSGHRVLSGAPQIEQRDLYVQLQWRTARPASPPEPEGLHAAIAGVLRSLPERRARARMDGERDTLLAAREREREIQDGVGYEGEGAELRKGVGSGEWGVGEVSYHIWSSHSPFPIPHSPLPTPHSPLPSGVSLHIFSFSLSSTNFLLITALSFGVRPPVARSSSMMIQPW